MYPNRNSYLLFLCFLTIRRNHNRYMIEFFKIEGYRDIYISVDFNTLVANINQSLFYNF